MVSCDKNTECHGSYQIILEKSLERCISILSNASWVELVHLDDARDKTKNPHSPAKGEWGFP
jgi:hypothetical protein